MKAVPAAIGVFPLTAFSPTDAALEGFRITRERPRALLAWVALYLLTTLISTIVLVTYAGETLMAISAMENSAEVDPAMTLALLGKLAPISFLGLVVATVFGAGVCRIILRPGDGSFAYLRLGADEVRLVALTLIYCVLSVIGVFIVALVLGVLIGIALMVLGVMSGQAGAPPPQLVSEVLGAAVVIVSIAVWVRFSMAWPMTFAEKRMRLFASWRLTRGSFWRLTGAYMLAAALAALVLALGLVVYAGVGTVITGGDLAAVGAVFHPDMSSLANYYTLPMIIYWVFVGVLMPLFYLIVFAPAAIAYRDLKGAGEG